MSTLKLILAHTLNNIKTITQVHTLNHIQVNTKELLLDSLLSNTKELLIKHGLASMKRHMKVHSQVRMLDTTRVLNSSLEPLKAIGQDSITKVT